MSAMQGLREPGPRLGMISLPVRRWRLVTLGLRERDRDEDGGSALGTVGDHSQT